MGRVSPEVLCIPLDCYFDEVFLNWGCVWCIFDVRFACLAMFYQVQYP